MATKKEIEAAFMATFGNQEGEHEAGVFALAADGWKLIDRHKANRMDLALEWAKSAQSKLAEKKMYERYRMSVVALPDTLEGVLADYETKRLARDPDFIPLEAPRVHAGANPEEVGECLAITFVGEFRGTRPSFRIVRRQNFASGNEANRVCKEQEAELARQFKAPVGTVYIDSGREVPDYEIERIIKDAIKNQF